MKKHIIFILFLIILLTGCFNKKLETKEILCAKKEISNNIVTIENIVIQLEKSKITELKFTIENELTKDYLKYQDLFISSLKDSYSNFEKEFNISPTIEKTDKGTKVTFNLTLEQYKEIFKEEDIYTTDDITKSFELEGYTCK